MTQTCAWCDAPKILASVCPHCGADYAKAEAIKLHGKAEQVNSTELKIESGSDSDIEKTNPSVIQHSVKDPQAEWRNCLLALPLMLFGAWLCQVFNIFDSLQRIVFGMPVHETGHALSAWLTGYNAIPSLWVTRTSPEQGFFAPLLLFVLYLLIFRYAYTRKQHFLFIPIVFLLLIQIIGTFYINNTTADMLIIWGGDGLGMIIATMMMSTFYLGKDTQLYKGSVRWGLLFWGAAAFMDIFMAWWEGQSDVSRIGYGKTGHNFTDAYRLINEYRWSWEGMFNSYLFTAYACLLLLVLIYTLGLLQAGKWKNENIRAEKLAKIKSTHLDGM